MIRTLTAVAAALLFAAGIAAAKTAPPPPGTKIASAPFYDIYVLKKEEKPGLGGYTERVYQVVVLAHTKKHGIQRYSRRVTTMDVDLLAATSWEIADLDGDGLADYRVLMQVTKKGCQTWDAERWEKDRERFTSGGMKLARFVDGHGKAVPNCVLR